ncbi:MAG: transcriptional repressor, partial [Bacteroidota bacterium]
RIHCFVNPSGRIKYALCSANGCEHEHQDNHAHFHCTACDKTTCLEGVVVPTITVPAAYQVEQTQLVLSGICGECS